MGLEVFLGAEFIPDELDQLRTELENETYFHNTCFVAPSYLLNSYENILKRAQIISSNGKKNFGVLRWLSHFSSKLGLTRRYSTKNPSLTYGHRVRFALAFNVLKKTKKVFDAEGIMPDTQAFFWALKQAIDTVVDGGLPAEIVIDTTDETLGTLLREINRSIRIATECYNGHFWRELYTITDVLRKYTENPTHPEAAIKKLRVLPDENYLAAFKFLNLIDPGLLTGLGAQAEALRKKDANFSLKSRLAFSDALFNTFEELLNKLANKLKSQDALYQEILWQTYLHENPNAPFKTVAQVTKSQQEEDFVAHYLAMIYGSEVYSDLAPIFFKYLQEYYRARCALETEDGVDRQQLAERCRHLERKIRKRWQALRTGYYANLEPMEAIPAEEDDSPNTNEPPPKGLVPYLDRSLHQLFAPNSSGSQARWMKAWKKLSYVFPVHNCYDDKLNWDLRQIREKQQAQRAEYTAVLDRLKKKLNPCAYPLGTPAQIRNIEKAKSPYEGNEDVLTTVRSGDYRHLFPYRVGHLAAETIETPEPLGAVVSRKKRRARGIKFYVKALALIAAISASLGEGAVAASGILKFSLFALPTPFLAGFALCVGISGFFCNAFLLYPDTFGTLKQYFIKRRYSYKDQNGKLIEGYARGIRLDKDNKLIPLPLFIGAAFFGLCALSVGVCYSVLSFNSSAGIASALIVGKGVLASILTLGFPAIPAFFTGTVIAFLLFTAIHRFISNHHYKDVVHYFKKNYFNFPWHALSHADRARVVLHGFANAGKLLLAISVTVIFTLFTYVLLQGGLLKLGLPTGVAMGVGVLNAITWLPLTLERLTIIATRHFSYTKTFVILPLTLMSIALLGLPLVISRHYTGKFFGWVSVLSRAIEKTCCLPETLCKLTERINAEEHALARNKMLNADDSELSSPSETQGVTEHNARTKHNRRIQRRRNFLFTTVALNTVGQAFLFLSREVLIACRNMLGISTHVTSLVGPTIAGTQSMALTLTSCDSATRLDNIPGLRLNDTSTERILDKVQANTSHQHKQRQVRIVTVEENVDRVDEQPLEDTTGNHQANEQPAETQDTIDNSTNSPAQQIPNSPAQQIPQPPEGATDAPQVDEHAPQAAEEVIDNPPQTTEQAVATPSLHPTATPRRKFSVEFYKNSSAHFGSSTALFRSASHKNISLTAIPLPTVNETVLQKARQGNQVIRFLYRSNLKTAQSCPVAKPTQQTTSTPSHKSARRRAATTTGASYWAMSKKSPRREVLAPIMRAFRFTST